MTGAVEEESVYNLISKNQINQCKKVKYKSKHNPNAPLVGSTLGLHGTTEIIGKGVHELKKSHVLTSTFGSVKNSETTDFLKKGSRNVQQVGGGKEQKKCFTRSICRTLKKPEVPTRYDKPILGLKSCKDFIKFNAAEVISSNAANKQQEPHDIDDSINKHHDEFGKVPIYLQKVKKEIEKENILVDSYVKNALSSQNQNQQQENHNNKEYEIMNEKDRYELIEKLKMKWDNVNHVYQKTCHRVQMEYGDVRRKEENEAELKRLESDIILLTQSGSLFIEK